MTPVDDLGTPYDGPRPVTRVVSLVPSLTETLASAYPERVVGATDWCTHPADLDVTRVRGTKNPDVAKIVLMAPDLVVANMEENRALDVERLREAGVRVWVTRIETVPQALRSIANLFDQALCWPRPAWLNEAEEVWDRPSPPVTRRVAIPIWRDPWMVVGPGTFTGDLVRRLGWENVFVYAADRYPRVTVEQIEAHAPDVVLLPDEPYVFTFNDGPEAFNVPTELVSGRLITWYGPSLADVRALADRG